MRKAGKTAAMVAKAALEGVTHEVANTTKGTPLAPPPPPVAAKVAVTGP